MEQRAILRDLTSLVVEHRLLESEVFEIVARLQLDESFLSANILSFWANVVTKQINSENRKLDIPTSFTVSSVLDSCLFVVERAGASATLKSLKTSRAVYYGTPSKLLVYEFRSKIPPPLFAEAITRLLPNSDVVQSALRLLLLKRKI